MKHEKYTNMENLMDKIISLCKRRGFIFPGSEIYGGLANSWDYGPLGVELKNNIKQMWWDRFVRRRSDVFGLDAALIMNPKVWEASGHLGAGFADELVECKQCHKRFRLDELISGGAISKSQFPISKQFPNHNFQATCKECGGELMEPRQFNLMLKTFLGPAEEKANEVYFRPETAQGMFVDFKNVLDTMRPRLPFGIAQVGKAFRNEITPGNFIFRTREFEQMEIEYFIQEIEWEKQFEYWRGEMKSWIHDLGIDMFHVHEAKIPDGERAHYSKRTIDFEYEYPFGRKELYGLAYRADFDLKNHFKEPPYRDPDTNDEFWPHVIEPTWGVDRSVLAVLLDTYREEGDPSFVKASTDAKALADKSEGKGGENKRVFLKFPPRIAPYQVAVFPLLANKPPLVEKAQAIFNSLKLTTYNLQVTTDTRGNIGKRYYAQDEIGTPWCVTVDFQTLEDNTVTVRDRDTAEQVRKPITELDGYFGKMLG
ncbi:MAG: glycyl-tRNA synthetase [Parcubacteria group bacterium Gr01-1014_70]|nr:MAG: glycyl-tRNA synthetase [Parcubacteria group bacterium Gr01-1014_70]